LKQNTHLDPDNYPTQLMTLEIRENLKNPFLMQESGYGWDTELSFSSVKHLSDSQVRSIFSVYK